jgi:hypothetical protein
VTRHALAFLASLLLCSPSYANFSMSPSGSTTLFAIDAANQGTSLCAASVTECAASVPINTAGAPLFTSAVPGQVGLNTAPTIANGNGVVPTIAGAVYSATNGAYFNQLQGNAVLSATNGGYQNVLQGNAALSATNGLYANLLQGNAVLSASNPLPANLAQMGGTAINSGCVASLSSVASTTIPATVCGAFGAWVLNATAPGQAAMAASSPVVLASNQTMADACVFQKKIPFNVSTGSTGTQVIPGTSSKNTYICTLSVIYSAAGEFSLVAGSGSSVCTGGTPLAIIGSTTAANGMAFAANGGLTWGNGEGTLVSDTNAAAQGYNICIGISGTTNAVVSGTYVQS